MKSAPVLLVEDEETDAFFMKRGFSQAGISTPLQIVEDGQKALDYLSGTGAYANRDLYPSPCLILLDLKLPYVHGLEVLRWIRSRREFVTMSVLVLSSSCEERDIESAFQNGANAFLVKPSDPEELLDMIKSLGAFWLRHNRTPNCAVLR